MKWMMAPRRNRSPLIWLHSGTTMWYDSSSIVSILGYTGWTFFFLFGGWLLGSTFLLYSISKSCVSGIRCRYLELVDTFLSNNSRFSLESDVVYSRTLSTYGVTLHTGSLGQDWCLECGCRIICRLRTKNRERLLILEKAAMRSGYSVTLVSPSSKEMFKEGCASSTSEKSIMFARLA